VTQGTGVCVVKTHMGFTCATISRVIPPGRPFARSRAQVLSKACVAFVLMKANFCETKRPQYSHAADAEMTS
jgi:hypothetical protein